MPPYAFGKKNIAVFQTVTQHAKKYDFAQLILIPILSLLVEHHPKTEVMNF